MPQMNRQRGEEPGSEAGRGYAYDRRALNWFSCPYILPNYLYSRPPRRFTCLVPSWDKHVVVDCSCFLCRSGTLTHSVNGSLDKLDKLVVRRLVRLMDTLGKLDSPMLGYLGLGLTLPWT